MAKNFMSSVLDELMGRNRDALPTEAPKQLEWDDPEVCPFYLVCFCPHELFVNTKADLGSCTRFHDDVLRKKYLEEAPNYRKAHHEAEFIRFAEKMIADIEGKIKRGKMRIALANGPDGGTYAGPGSKNAERISLLTERINALLEEAESAGCEGDVEKAQGLMKLCDQIKEERDQLKSNEVSHPWNPDKAMQVCEVCGSYLIIGEAQHRLDDHIMGKQHVGFAMLRKNLEDVRKNQEKRDQEDRERMEKEREKRAKEREARISITEKKADGEGEKEKEKDRDSRRDDRRSSSRRDRDKDRDRDRDNRDRDRDRERDRDRDRKRRRSRSRDKGKDSEREKDRHRDRDRDRDKRRRDSSRDKDKDKDKERDKDRKSHRHGDEKRSRRSRSKSRDRERHRRRSRSSRRSRDRKDKHKDRGHSSSSRHISDKDRERESTEKDKEQVPKDTDVPEEDKEQVTKDKEGEDDDRPSAAKSPRLDISEIGQETVSEVDVQNGDASAHESLEESKVDSPPAEDPVTT